MRKEFRLGEAAEWYWGLAYHDHIRRVAVCYIIPLNWIVWIFREIHWKLRSTPPSTFDKMYSTIYQKGWDDALKYKRANE